MIQEAVDTRQFRFSAIVDEVYQDVIPKLLELEDRLNEELELSDYTDVVETIYFIPMILEDRAGYEERLEYDGEFGEVFLQVFASPEENFSVILISSVSRLEEKTGSELLSEKTIFEVEDN